MLSPTLLLTSAATRIWAAASEPEPMPTFGFERGTVSPQVQGPVDDIVATFLYLLAAVMLFIAARIVINMANGEKKLGGRLTLSLVAFLAFLSPALFIQGFFSFVGDIIS